MDSTGLAGGMVAAARNESGFSEESVTCMEDDPFPGTGLRSVELTDRPTISPYFASLTQPLSDFTFSQIFTWRNSLRILWTILEDHLCVFANGAGDLTLLMPPIGQGRTDKALTAAFEMMNDYNAAHGVPNRSRVEYASAELLARIDTTGFSVQPMGADYVYDTQRMIDLAGGDLASKRQAKNRFMRNYRYRVEQYDPVLHLEDCRRLLDTWKIHQDAQHLDESKTNAIKRQKESIATDLTLQQSGVLGLTGMVVYCAPAIGPVDEPMQLKAFTFGEWLGCDQSSITIEKTDLELKGLAQFIFSDFVQKHWSARPLVNVGDDWGLESLSWTKMSYRPVKLLEKFVLRKTAAVRIAVPAMAGAPALSGAIEYQAMAAAASDAGIESPAIVRSACKDDLAAAVDLEKACFASYSLNKRRLQYLQGRSSAVFLVAEDGGALAGECIGLIRQHKSYRSGRIYSLAVAPEKRGRKLGQALLRAMIAELCSRGVKRIYLEVEEHNEAAIALYEKNGFRHIGVLPGYYGAEMSGRHMMCEIPAVPSLFDALVEAA